MKYYTWGDWIVRRKDDWEEGDPQSYITPSESNVDYQIYLEWVEEGNTAEVLEEN